ncbi:hypothetical protein Thermo_01910 [Thermoplasmatales archaeon]|nr:hypothetical protein Thermo_01910 [Thermoplasmatales archaeon]
MDVKKIGRNKGIGISRMASMRLGAISDTLILQGFRKKQDPGRIDETLYPIVILFYSLGSSRG